MTAVHLVCMILALVCFVCAALKYEPARVNLTALGLALWIVTLLFR